MTPDPLRALEDVVETGAARILTSGGVPTVPAGIETIVRLVEAAGTRIGVMPGSGLTANNIAHIARTTGAHEFHTSARTPSSSPMKFRKTGMAMGDAQDREYSRFVVLPETVRTLVKALESAHEPLVADL
jgi:copper homeostasis protein